MSNKIEKYDTRQKEVKVWLNQIFKTFENPDLSYPLLIHCLSGKDRTGIVVAALLLILDINEEIIKEEYLLSDGEVHLNLLDLTLNGLRDIDSYFSRIDLAKVKDNLSKNLINYGN